MSVHYTKDKKATKREQFLEAARGIFARKGYQATNVSDIVAEVESGQGTFYYHFKDKQAIFDELMLGFIGELGKAAAESATAVKGKPALAVRHKAIENARRFASVFLDNIDLATLYFRESRYVGGEAMERLELFYDFLYAQIENGLKEGKSLGLVRPELDNYCAARCFVGASERLIYDVIRTKRRVDVDFVAGQIVDFLSHGLLSGESERPAGAKNNKVKKT